MGLCLLAGCFPFNVLLPLTMEVKLCAEKYKGTLMLLNIFYFVIKENHYCPLVLCI